MKARVIAVPTGLAARRVIADPANLAVAVLFYVLVVAALSGLWRAAAGTQLVAGYSALALTWYIAASEAAITSIDARMIEQVGDDVASGAVAVEMLRPVAVVAVRLMTATGRCLARLASLAAVGVVVAWLIAGAPPSWRALSLAGPSLVLAVACNVALQHAVAGVSFWIRDARSAWFLYQKLVFILGGMLLPLQVLPDALYEVALRLPFAAMAYAPARLASGHFEPWLLGLQVAWLVVLTGISVGVFAAGQRRLQVVGG